MRFEKPYGVIKYSLSTVTVEISYLLNIVTLMNTRFILEIGDFFFRVI